MVACHIYFLCTTVLMYFKYGSLFFMLSGLVSLVFVLYLWGKDVCLEGLSGHHAPLVQQGFKTAFLLFVFSELMFFVSIFWVYFDASLSPSIEVGGVWPPFGVSAPNFLGLPLFGTAVLLSSGATVTWSHAQLLSNSRASYSLGLTVGLAILFLGVQYWEYSCSPLSMSDSVYGSSFYFSTGFHGFHVFVGALFLMVSLGRLVSMHFSPLHHTGLEMSLLYWHFVDVVWVFLYLFVYTWGS